ncbi:hypothetical protein KHA94_20920 [Bacillus sp. FJAT-49705]|uniref:Uncharacterized protein n=1 Tax=Cytobacillus citreus TaxID=2833586 RepID=A0ABS5NZ13_9BACI|nr:hypothetical protein [Cytobacillus citreus]
MAFGSLIGWGAFILPADWIQQAGALGSMIGLSLRALVIRMRLVFSPWPYLHCGP